MIALDRIIESNLEMLKAQEGELMKSLAFVQKAIQLFESQNETPAPKKGVRKKQAVTKTKTASPSAIKAKVTKGSKRTRTVKGGSRLSKIIEVLKGKGQPMNSKTLIEILFKQQSKDKNLAHFRQGVYTTLTGAYKSGVIKNNDGMMSL